MSNFITNNPTRELKKRLIELIEKSRELKFLVGFFYFSGIRELYAGLKSNPEETGTGYFCLQKSLQAHGIGKKKIKIKKFLD